MHPLLNKILKQRGIEDASKLNEEEAQDFDRWESILSGGKMTIEKLQTFCEAQVAIIEKSWRGMEFSEDTMNRLVCCHTVYKVILEAINAPDTERETLERYLRQMLTEK